MSLQVEIHYGRKAKVAGRDYEMQESHISFTSVLDATMGAEAIQAHVRQQHNEAKALVLTELGLAFNTDPQTGRIVETFPGATPVASSGQAVAHGPATIPTPTLAGPSPVQSVPPLTAVPPQQFVDPNMPVQGYPPAQQHAQAHLGQQGVAPAGEVPFHDPMNPSPAAVPQTPLPDPSTLTEWKDKCWYDLLTQPDNWYDNRATKKGPNHPDFKAKDKAKFPQKGQMGAEWPEGLYLQSQYGSAPDWVLGNLYRLG